MSYSKSSLAEAKKKLREEDPSFFNKRSSTKSSRKKIIRTSNQETKKKIDETYLKKIDVIFSKINYWLEADDRYSFILEPLTEEA